MLSEFLGAKHISKAHMTRLKHLLNNSSKGRYDKNFAEAIRNAAKCGCMWDRTYEAYLEKKRAEDKH